MQISNKDVTLAIRVLINRESTSNLLDNNPETVKNSINRIRSLATFHSHHIGTQVAAIFHDQVFPLSNLRPMIEASSVDYQIVLDILEEIRSQRPRDR